MNFNVGPGWFIVVRAFGLTMYGFAFLETREWNETQPYSMPKQFNKCVYIIH